MKALKCLLVFFAALLGFVSQAFAAVDLLGFAVDIASVETMAGIILTGLAAMWGIRKLIKTINRS